MLLDRIGPPGWCSGCWLHDVAGPIATAGCGGPALTPLVTLTRARARPWSARCYGVARQRDGSRQNSIGVSGVLSLRHFGLVLFIHIGAWVPKNLARRVLIYWFRRRDAARPDRAAWVVQRLLAARCRRPDRNSWLRGPRF